MVFGLATVDVDFQRADVAWSVSDRPAPVTDRGDSAVNNNRQPRRKASKPDKSSRHSKPPSTLLARAARRPAADEVNDVDREAVVDVAAIVGTTRSPLSAVLTDKLASRPQSEPGQAGARAEAAPQGIAGALRGRVRMVDFAFRPPS